MPSTMSTPKLDKALRLLVAIDREPRSSVALGEALDISRPHVVRLVASLRELGCKIESVHGTGGRGVFDYHLHDWGVFDAARVRRYVKGLK